MRPSAIAGAPELKIDTAVISRWKRQAALLVSDAGTVTVEFMLWMPLIFTLILFAIDVALIYLNQANMWTAARDQARRLSVSSTYTNTNAATNGQAELFSSLQTACNSTCVVATGGTTAGTDKVVTIQIPLCQASLFGIVGCYDATLKLTARVTMASEY